MTQVNKLYIKGLHGFKNYDFQIRDNILIMVGENGSGKTTVLRILYYLLSGQWTHLFSYKFDQITIRINEQDYTITHNMAMNFLKQIDSMLFRRLPAKIRAVLLDAIEAKGYFDLQSVKESCDKYDFPLKLVLNEIDYYLTRSGENRKIAAPIIKQIKDSIDFTVLYLPTYRRIEEELSTILHGAADIDLKYKRKQTINKSKASSIELVEFGMNDVDELITYTMDRLLEKSQRGLNALTIGYLGDIVERKYENLDLDSIKAIELESIEKALGRVQENILSSLQKTHIIDNIKTIINGGGVDDHAKVICHYLIKLMQFQNELSKEEKLVRSFCNVCNDYLSNKKFDYDSNKFQVLLLHLANTILDREVELKHLSSGEKQIVSLFSQLYLGGDNEKYFVIIDEPEMSLSVPWQRRFLNDVVKGENCAGLISATHSPFIYDNQLRRFARGIGEFEV